MALVLRFPVLKSSVHTSQINAPAFCFLLKTLTIMLGSLLAFTTNVNAQNTVVTPSEDAMQVKPSLIKLRVAPLKVLSTQTVSVYSLSKIKATPVNRLQAQRIPVLVAKPCISCYGKVLDATDPVIKLVSPSEMIENNAKVKTKK